MITFKIDFSGDFLNENGDVANGYAGEDILNSVSYIDYDFLRDQAPSPNDPTYGERLYSLVTEPSHIVQANGLVICRSYVNKSTFAQGADNLVVIGRAGVGTDKIDLDVCTENDVAVFNAPGTLIHSTASAGMLLILALARKLPAQERLVRSGNWNNQADAIGNDLTGQTLGIVGLGKIGAEMVRLLAPFQMKVIAYRGDPVRAKKLGVTRVEDLDTVLRGSDYVSLNCSLNDETRGMIGEREFRLMKPTAYFINVSRGELVQQDAMVRALQEGWIAGAGLDVFEYEPLPADNPLIKLDNVILTPHWLSTTHKVVRGVMGMMANGMVKAAQGMVPKNVVNADVLDRPGFQAKLARFAVNAQQEQKES